MDADGTPQFGISQSTQGSSDGSISLILSVSFAVPERPGATRVGIPLVGLDSQTDTEGGGITGGQTLYYAVSAVDANGAESALSLTIMAIIPAGTNTNQVTLPTLSFSSTSVAFDVYRGATPVQLLRIAENHPIAAQFSDMGRVSMLKAPPDSNYDHANFYWRLELQPEVKADIQSATTIGNSSLTMVVNEYAGAVVRIAKGTGAGQERTIARKFRHHPDAHK